MKNEKKKLISEILVLSESKVNEILEKIKIFHIFFLQNTKYIYFKMFGLL